MQFTIILLTIIILYSLYQNYIIWNRLKIISSLEIRISRLESSLFRILAIVSFGKEKTEEEEESPLETKSID